MSLWRAYRYVFDCGVWLAKNRKAKLTDTLTGAEWREDTLSQNCRYAWIPKPM